MTNSSAKRDNGLQSVNRAVSVLQVLARRGPTGITDLAAELEIHKSTAFRLLATLESRGLVDQSGSRGRYQLGYGVVQLAAGATGKLDLSTSAREVCERLAAEVGESVDISILDDGAVLTIDQVVGASAMTSSHWVGRRTPLHATSSGKIFLADLPEADLDAYLEAGLHRFTEGTVTDPTTLLAELDVVRERGWGHSLEEYEVGLAAVAAPLRDLDGRILATVSVSGPTFRVNAETIPEIAVLVESAATEISERLGQPKPG